MEQEHYPPVYGDLQEEIGEIRQRIQASGKQDFAAGDALGARFEAEQLAAALKAERAVTELAGFSKELSTGEFLSPYCPSEIKDLAKALSRFLDPADLVARLNEGFQEVIHSADCVAIFRSASERIDWDNGMMGVPSNTQVALEYVVPIDDFRLAQLRRNTQDLGIWAFEKGDPDAASGCAELLDIIDQATILLCDLTDALFRLDAYLVQSI